MRAEGRVLSSRVLVPALTAITAFVVGVSVNILLASPQQAVTATTGVILVGTLIQGSAAVERAIVRAAQARRTSEVRAVLRLGMAMGVLTALALGVVVLGVPADLEGLDFGTAVFLVLCACALNLVCGQIAGRYAAALERHTP